ncbi:MAG TPA: FAD:protein FMN transferase [Flavobacteriaceae bacterium]|nr:FAD:protein FMN transferase [Flavobacteriaceae bacterium]
MKHVFFILALALMVSCKKAPENTKLSGAVFGTTYTISYDSEVNYQVQFDSLFAIINNSMSTYIPNSLISRLNKGEDLEVDAHFAEVFNQSKKIYRETEGAFDPTIGAVVNAWDFGPEGKIVGLDSVKVDSLMKQVGFNRMGLVENRLVKSSNGILDFNAIAKGYGVDVIGRFLESKQVENYLVEIGGEIRCKGVNIEKESSWKVGVEMPHFDGTQSIMKAISMNNGAMATSGTYRKFKVDENGNRYSHIIDTKTGYSSKTNLLSISVIASECTLADGYATAFKAMGIEKVEAFLAKHPELKVFLIFENEKGELETKALNGFPEA